MEVKFINFKGERCKCDLRGYLLGGVIELFIFNPDTREYGRKISLQRVGRTERGTGKSSRRKRLYLHGPMVRQSAGSLQLQRAVLRSGNRAVPKSGYDHPGWNESTGFK